MEVTMENILLRKGIDPDSVVGLKLRWRTENYKLWPWLPKACKVRILLYTDSATLTEPLPDPFVPGSTAAFDLGKVKQVLESDPWYWVKFDVDFKQRTNVTNRLDQLNLKDNYDEVWLFGIGSTNVLTAAEISAIDDFTRHGGGVLITGDHANLGYSIGGEVPRAGKMRQWPAPDSMSPEWNNTLEEGPTAGYQFADQSDDTPQKIRLRTYPLGSGWSQFFFKREPHPLFCSQWGPIKVHPDHQHEGEAVVPATFPETEWPKIGGHQELPEVIAWGKIKSPDADVGREVGLVSVYDGHKVNIGRVVADSTWHHYFNINLWGYSATSAGLDALKYIEAHFLNVGVWLASPKLQKCMLASACWGILWHWKIKEVLTAKPHILGAEAHNVLGKYASQCTIYKWIIDLFPTEVVKEIMRIREPGVTPPLGPVENVVLGEILAAMRDAENDLSKPRKPQDLDSLVAFVEPAVGRGLTNLMKIQEQSVQNNRKLIDTTIDLMKLDRAGIVDLRASRLG